MRGKAQCGQNLFEINSTYFGPFQRIVISPVVIIALTKGFDWTIPSKILFPFPWNPYLKEDGTSLLILFLVKKFEEKEIKFSKERFCKKLPSNDDNNWAIESTKIFWKYLVKLKEYKNSNTNSNSLLGYCVQVENSRACKCFPFPLQISLSVIEIAVSDF